MPGNIGMISPNDFIYMAHLIDEAYEMNAIPVTIKRVSTQSKANKDELFDEVTKPKWDRQTLNAIVVNRPMKEILDRYATRNPIKLIVSVSYLELQRKGWKILPSDVIEYPDMYGKMVDYFIESVVHDGEFRDTDGNQHALSYTILLNDEKVPTNGIKA